MRILIGSAHPYLPQLIGGAQSSTHELALALMRRGHEVCVVAGMTGGGWHGLRWRLELKLPGRRWVVDRDLGYPTYRSWFPYETVLDTATKFRADVVLFQSGFPVKMADAMSGSRIPTLIYLHNVEEDDLGGRPSELANVSFIANSHFTARKFAASDGVDATVIYPMIAKERYRAVCSRRNVTFVNPHAFKGVDIALKVAERCPDIPFAFVKAWTISPEEESALEDKIKELGNVTLQNPTMDMRSVYGEARILLVPSRWEEAFGRVAAEAHINGIPVVGSDRGGLPEAIGPGGIIIPIDAPAEEWASAVQLLWSDEHYYETTSDAARQYSLRLEMDESDQVDKIIGELQSALTKREGSQVPHLGPPKD